MKFSEAKQILNENGYVLNESEELGTYDSILYLYLTLKKEGISGLPANTNIVTHNKMFTVKIEKEFDDLSERAGKTVKATMLIFNEEGIDIMVAYGDDKVEPQRMAIPMDRENYEIDDRLTSILQKHFKDFIEVDVHNTVYEYLFKKK
jgi:hypothetical protein